MHSSHSVHAVSSIPKGISYGRSGSLALLQDQEIPIREGPHSRRGAARLSATVRYPRTVRHPETFPARSVTRTRKGFPHTRTRTALAKRRITVLRRALWFT
jgi:hypothetical protein